MCFFTLLIKYCHNCSKWFLNSDLKLNFVQKKCLILVFCLKITELFVKNNNFEY